MAIVIVMALSMTRLSANPLLTHLQNGGFEQQRSSSSDTAQVSGWNAYGDGYSVDRQTCHSGRQSIRCQNGPAPTNHGASLTVTLGQTEPMPIVVTGWSKAEDVEGSLDGDYSVYVELQYIDGTWLWEQTSDFEPGTHDWQERHLLIVPAKPVRQITVYAMFRNHSGTVWFDDFDAHEIPTTLIFDGQQLAAPKLAGSSSDGWFLRDVAANSQISPLLAGKNNAGVRLASLTVRPGGVMSAILKNETSRTRAVTIYYLTRFREPNAVWWNDIESSEPIMGAPDLEYHNWVAGSVGANGFRSLYPFGCVTGARAPTRAAAPNGGLALAIPPWLGPRVSRIGYNAHAGLLYAAFDIALEADGDPAGHDTAQVAIARYATNPSWGFRDAAAKFYALFPEAFIRRVQPEGIWMPFTDPSHIANAQDFHFGYHEGDNSIVTDRKQNILSFRYIEPMTYWMPMPKNVPRTYDAALTQLQRQAASTDPHVSIVARRQSQAVLTSGTVGPQGRLNVTFRNAPWCNGAVWVLNPDPSVPHPPGLWTSSRLIRAASPDPAKANEPDGEFLDSLEMWCDVLDYNPNSLRYTTEPATFTPDNFAPVLPTWFNVYEATQCLSDYLHAHGKLLFANATPWGFTAFGPLLDVMGTETNMFDNGKWSPEPEARFNLRRTLCYHKPYLLLINTDFTKVGTQGIELYFQRCLFYGVFPSMYSADAADHPYWEDPKLYNRDRPLFKQYIPVIQKLSSAGWEPVTWARSDTPDVLIERYGTKYLTVLNTATEPRTVEISIDAAHFGAAKPDSEFAVSDAMTGQKLAVLPAQPPTEVQISLQPSETRVLSLTPGVQEGAAPGKIVQERQKL